MESDRITHALARIGAAAERIDACSLDSRDSRALEESERRYAALRDQAGAALRELDAIIAALEK